MMGRKPRSGKIYLSSVTDAVAALNRGIDCANTRSIAKVTERAGYKALTVRSAREEFDPSVCAAGAPHSLSSMSMIDTSRGRVCMPLRFSSL